MEDTDAEKKIIRCDFRKKNLFTCILEELHGEDFKKVLKDPSLEKSEVTINCLNAGLITCLSSLKSDSRERSIENEAELIAYRTEQGVWRVRTINVKVDVNLDEKYLIKRIEECLKYIQNSCNINDAIKFNVVENFIAENLRDFKIQLLEVNDWLKKVKSDKKNLFDLFT